MAMSRLKPSGRIGDRSYRFYLYANFTVEKKFIEETNFEIWKHYECYYDNEIDDWIVVC